MKSKRNLMTLAHKCAAGGSRKKFYIGAVNVNGEVVEVHTYEEATCMDFQPDFLFSEEIVTGAKKDDSYSYFWMNTSGTIESDNEFTNEIEAVIREQITF